MSQPDSKKSKSVESATVPIGHEESRLKEIVERALEGKDVSALLISVNGTKVEPCTPVVGRIVSASHHQQNVPPALHLACHCGDLAAVKRLLEVAALRGSLAAIGGPRNWLPVMYAVGMGHLAIVKLLRAAGSPMPQEKLLCRAVAAGQTQILAWLLGADNSFDMNASPKALAKAVLSDIPHTLTTVLSLCRLNEASLNVALEVAVRSGSAARLSHLLDAGASASRSRALVVACEENATLMAHKLLATCSSEEVAAFGPCLIESAARHANPELTAVLLSRGAQRSGGAVRLALQSGRPDEDVTRVLLALLRRGAGFSSSSSAADPRLEVAMRMLADPRPAVIEGAPLQRARLVGAEPDFVNDTPVPAPRHFECHLRSGAVTTIGRSDPGAGHHVNVDMANVFSAASVSRTHALLRFHDSRQVWQIRVCGRNGLFDEGGKFFPPQADDDDWIDLSVFPNNKFEIGWVKLELKIVHDDPKQ